jgi:hypothetical protein
VLYCSLHLQRSIVLDDYLLEGNIETVDDKI